MKSVSVKTAKSLDLGMNPNRLSGMCGRLKCCLNFEMDEASRRCCAVDDSDDEPFDDLINLET